VELENSIMNEVIRKVVAALSWIQNPSHINPTGRFVVATHG